MISIFSSLTAFFFLCFVDFFFFLLLFTNPTAALPLAIIGMPLLFYVVMFSSQLTMEDVRNDGWIAPIQNSTSFTQVFQMFQFQKVHWNILPYVETCKKKWSI